MATISRLQGWTLLWVLDRDMLGVVRFERVMSSFVHLL